MHYWVDSGVHHHRGLHRHVPYHYQRTDSGVYSHVLGGVGAGTAHQCDGIPLHAREREEKKKKHQEEESNSEHNYKSDEDDDFNNSEWELEE
jgi:hypothetical protein